MSDIGDIKYSHIFCKECKTGIVGWRGWSGDNTLSCDQCGKEYSPYELEYDCIQINCKTGWNFPMVAKKKELSEPER